MPRVSIVVPAYDNADNIPACLDSVGAQTYKDWEVVVVVDGSPDNSAEIVTQYCAKDSRVRLVNKPRNEGTHRARMSGVEAARGDYLLFLDADDELAPQGLQALVAIAQNEPSADVIHFGMEQLNAGVSPEMYAGFLASCNQQFPALTGLSIAESSFIFKDGPTQDWRVLQRLYKASLVKKAFSLMTKERLGRGQDAYEWLVISSLASQETFHNELIAYRYFFGRGITNISKMSSEKFGNLSQSYAHIINEASDWARRSKFPETDSCVRGLANRLCELLFGDWQDRVPDDEKDEALSLAASSIGGMAAAAELMRLSRDDAYAHWDTGDSFDPDARYMRLFELGERYADEQEPSERYTTFHDAAARHIADLKGRSQFEGRLGAVDRVRRYLRRRFGKVERD